MIYTFILLGQCDIDAKNLLGQTPLMRAVYNDNQEIVKLLIKAGALSYTLTNQSLISACVMHTNNAYSLHARLKKICTQTNKNIKSFGHQLHVDLPISISSAVW